MEVTDALMLRDDVLIVPVRDLEEEVRKAIECDVDDFAISRPLARNPSTIVDAKAAELVELFRQPRTIVEAVILFCHKRGLVPEEVLEEAYPLVVRLMQSRYLKFAGEENSGEPAGPSFSKGEMVDGLRVVRLLYLLEDTELYLVKTEDGSTAALKMARPEAGPQLEPLLRHEAAVLRLLKGRVGPALLMEGRAEDRRYLLMEWCSGVDAQTAAAEWSNGNRSESREQMLQLLLRITEAYAELHQLGVLHGDVHPRNILVAGDLSVRLIDFGFARLQNTDRRAADADSNLYPRGGIPFFFEPEYAREMLDGNSPPPVTPAAEQYALGAMLYNLVTGVHYLDFNLEREKMLRQILDEAPISFAERQIEAWPEIEKIFSRALQKAPKRRFPSIAAMARELQKVSLEGKKEPASSGRRGQASTALTRAYDRILSGLQMEGPLFAGELSPAPLASVNFGAAGIAYGLYRIACSQDDARWLALADAWACKAATAIGKEEGFYNREFELTPETVGEASPFHSASGIYAVQALIARAMGDSVSQITHLENFLAASEKGHQGFDLTLGLSSTLLALAFLLDALPKEKGVDPDPLQQAGNDILKTIWQKLDALPAIQEAEIDYPGIAHGWAGFLYATLQWCRASGANIPAGLEPRLQQLSELAEPQGRGLTWPWMLQFEKGGDPAYMSGWCNGSSGYLFLWTLAWRLLENPVYLDLAEGAAWDAWDAPDTAASLCCGLVGRSYALLNLHKHTGEPRWLERARELGRRAAEFGQFEESHPHSLYKGEISLAVLAADLEHPETALFPFFEEEGWTPINSSSER